MEHMIPLGTKIYKESNGQIIIDRIFATQLLLERLISYDIARNFDHDSDHEQILSKWIMRTIHHPPTPWFILRKIDICLIKKTLKKELAKNLLNSCTMPE